MSGLYMLVAQAKRTAEVFENRDIPDSETERIWKKLSLEMQNIVLVGMPGSGKSTVAARLAERLDRIALDSDAEIEEKNGMSCAQLIEKHGEAEFRELESEAIAELGKRSGAVIATGGGCVTREENLRRAVFARWRRLRQGMAGSLCKRFVIAVRAAPPVDHLHTQGEGLFAARRHRRGQVEQHCAERDVGVLRAGEPE